MNESIIKYMLENEQQEPFYVVNYIHNLGRGLTDETRNSCIKGTKRIRCWRIVGKDLEEVASDRLNILFDEESYLTQWEFVFESGKNIRNETVYFHWNGQNANKGFSPLPKNLQAANPVVERISQWSESALFLQMFNPKLLVLKGNTKQKFNKCIPRLFILRGEIRHEVHFYEVPCKKSSLRSKTCFLEVIPEKEVFLYWHGALSNEYLQNMFSVAIRPHEILKNFVSEWHDFTVLELTEGNETDEFLESLEGENTDYHSCSSSGTSTSTKLFYFNSVTGNFWAASVLYPLYSKTHTIPYPVLQSHLYTATQPALFLLDNENELWLWKGWKPTDFEGSLDKFNIEFQSAKDITEGYAKEREKLTGNKITIRYTQAGREPLEFTNFFPFWVDRIDISDAQRDF